MNFLRCCVYLFFIGILGFFIGRLIPHKWLKEECFPYRSYKFEKDGTIYEKIGIKNWHNKVPDMSKILPNMVPSKVLDGNVYEKTPLLIKESCVAELIHKLLAVAALYCLVLWNGIGGMIVTLLFEIGNLPYILIQRYNRPRLSTLYQKIKARQSRLDLKKETVEVCQT